MPLLLGIDFGTSYFKVALFSPTGGLRGLAPIKIEPTVRHPGWAELETERFWRLLKAGLDEALRTAQAEIHEIVGVSYSSQANTFVLLDEAGKPLTPLVLWTDTRARPDPGLEDFSQSREFAEATGFCGMSPLWAAAKLQWFQQHEPEIWRQTAHIKTLSDYFVFVLTGQHAGDAGTAAFLGLYELRRQDWWLPVLRHFGITPSQLSRPLLPGTGIGSTVAQSTATLGLPGGVTVTAGGLDHQVAALGSGMGKMADASISTGTVLAAMRLVTEPRPTAGCYHGPHFCEGDFYRLAFDPQGAGQLEVLQLELCPEAPIGEMIRSALPEYSETKATAFLKASERSRVRAVLYDIAESHLRLLRRISQENEIRTVVATGGGARSRTWLRLKADLFSLPIKIPACPERACLGAAILAAHTAGIWPDLDTATKSMVTWEEDINPGFVPRPN